ncbi:MAG: glutamate racemase [Paludibacteraceae bacterium]|nr:glutamate racemase [Paludibacteraceae bacterium]
MKIGVFDSGFGGLTILQNIRQVLPEYDYLYLGDSARAPYGTRSFEVIYEYTLQAVRYLEAQGCRLIIIACNTASAKALRTIQQRDINPDQLRVLGVIRPTVEAVTTNTLNSRHIGILATPGTVSSGSYLIELEKLDPHLEVSQQACPMWVPLIENNEIDSPAMDYYIKKYVDLLFVKDPEIDTIILACTHYPLIKDKIEAYLNSKLPPSDALLECADAPLNLISQGAIVANSLRDYLNRHSEIERELSRGGQCAYLTTDIADKFEASASLFLSEPIHANQIELV